MRAIIRTSASLAETTHDGRTVFDHDVTSRGALDYANAADELTRQYFPEAAAAGAAPSASAAPPPEAQPVPPPEASAPRPWEPLHRAS
jgi:chromosome partitioning protein